MISKEHEKLIDNYLIEQKLSLDLVIEIKDHFINQIQDYQRSENIVFEEAFDKTKNDWKGELELQNKFVFSKLKYELVSPFYEKIVSKNNQNFLLISIASSVVFFLFLLLSARNLSKDHFIIFFGATHALLVLISLIYLISNKKLADSTKNKYTRKISVYQKPANYIYFGVVFIFIVFVLSFQSKSERFYEIFMLGENTSLYDIVVHIIFANFYYTSLAFGLINFYHYKKSIQQYKILL